MHFLRTSMQPIEAMTHRSIVGVINKGSLTRILRRIIKRELHRASQPEPACNHRRPTRSRPLAKILKPNDNISPFISIFLRNRRKLRLATLSRALAREAARGTEPGGGIRGKFPTATKIAQ
jgi:hypothetical protein